MSINLDNVKAITHNNKDVIKIEDSQGRIIWQLQSTPEILYYSYESGATLIQKKLENNTFSDVTWGITHAATGNNIWSDGENIYYSSDSGNTNYVLDESNMTWSAKTWIGQTTINGNRIWTDGTDIFYSNGSTSQKVLDKSTSTWSTKTWNGAPSSLAGNYIWYLNVNGVTRIMFSNAGSQYYFRTNNSTWTTFNWSASGSDITSFYGYNVWTDGTNTYLSQDNKTYVLTYTSGGKWTEITSNGTTAIPGGRMFKYNGEIYGIENNSPYEVYKLTSADTTQVTWTKVTFTDQPVLQAAFRGDMFWNTNGRSSASAVMFTKKTV